MIKCQRCNTENVETAQYCDDCGSRLSPSAPNLLSVPGQEGHEQVSSAHSAKSVDPASNLSSAPNRAGAASQNGEASVARIGAQSDGAGTARVMPVPFTASAKTGFENNNARAKLVVQRGRSAGKEFALSDDEVEIGRWDADGGIFPEVDLDADDPEAKVSRRHARITRRDGGFFIEDLGSTNGTFINRGRRLLPGDRQPLRDGDEVIVGKIFLRFYIVN